MLSIAGLWLDFLWLSESTIGFRGFAKSCPSPPVGSWSFSGFTAAAVAAPIPGREHSSRFSAAGKSILWDLSRLSSCSTRVSR